MNISFKTSSSGNTEILKNVEFFIDQILQEFATSEDFSTTLSQAFGSGFNLEKAELIRKLWSSGDFQGLPIIEVRSSADINKANAAFSQDTNTIYIAQEYLVQNSQNPRVLINALLQEIGHFVDSQINTNDSPGDEGVIFATLVRGQNLAKEEIVGIQQLDDTATITLDGQVIQIEQATVSDSGGFEGSQQTVKLESKNGGVAQFSYEHFFIPDNFIIRYEGKNILETGFVGGGQEGTVKIPKGNSDQLEVIVATDDAGTAWNYTVETKPIEININGSLGDIIEIDVEKELQKQGFSLKDAGLSKGSIQLKDNSNGKGKVAEIDNWQGELKNGKFYFAPTTNGTPLVFNQSRSDVGIGKSTLVLTSGDVEINVNFNVQNGYQENVTFGSKKLDLYRQEQRLSYLGFPQESNIALVVNGKNDGNELSWATQLFNIAVDGRTLSARGRISGQSKTLKSYINSVNAPKWTDLNGIPNFQFVGTPRTYGTSGSANIINGAVSALGRSLESSGVSKKNGSGDPSKTHDGGRGVDIDTPGREIIPGSSINHGSLFFKEKKVGGIWFVASSNNGIITRDENGTYTVGDANDPTDRQRGLTTAALVSNARTVLPEISGLLVDNSAVDYTLENSRQIINAFKGQGIQKILFNDPRTWTDGAEFTAAHWGHIHFEVPVPPQAAPQRSQQLRLSIPQAPSFNAPLSQQISTTFVALSSSLPLVDAIDLGAFEGSKNLVGVINSVNSEQYYKFVLGNPINEEEVEGEYFGTPRNFSLLLDGLSENADVELIRDYNEDGIRQDEEVLISSEQASNNPESINLTDLPEATYYVRVLQKGGDTNYNLNLTIPPLPIPPDGAGNSTTTAFDLGTLNGSRERNDFIGQVDPDDYYRFTLEDATDLNINVEGLQNGDLSLTLGVDDNNDGVIDFDETVAISNVEGNEPENINISGLEKGTYYIHLERNSGNSNYALNLSGTPSVIPLDKAGETPSTGLDIGFLTGTSNFSDFVGNVDPNDFYRFSLGNVKGLNITLDGLSSDADLELAQDSNNDGFIDSDEIISTSELEGSDAEVINVAALTPGEYFVRVHQYEGNTNYNLSIAPTNPVGSDLSVVRTSNAATINLGEEYTYTLTVTNNGPDDATGVVLTENLPSGIDFVRSTGTTPINLFGQRLTADLENIRSGGSATVELTFKSIVAGDLLSTVNVTGNEDDYNTANNLLISTTTINPVTPASADLELNKTVSKTNPNVGDRITFDLSLTNSGPGLASGIKVSDLLPSGLRFVSAFADQGIYDSRTGVWDVGNMRDNLSRSLRITSDVVSAGVITNTAEIIDVNETDPDSTPGNNNPNEDDQASVTITTLGTNPGQLVFSGAAYSVNEDGTPIQAVTISRTGGSDGRVGITITPSNGTTTAPDDYNNTPITVNFANGETSKTVVIPIVDDTLVEGNETVNLTLSNPTGGAILGTQTTAVLTIVDNDTVTTPGINIDGTPNDDNLTGTPGDDTIRAFNSQDILSGLGGSDTLDGGDGDDKLFGGDGNDSLLGGSGQDQIFGEVGNDTLNGDDGDDKLFGGDGDDILFGGQGNDQLVGDAGDDILTGGSGDNILTGGLGKDIFVLSTEGKNNIIDFQSGLDLIGLSGGLTFGSLSIYAQNNGTVINTINNQPLAFLASVNSNSITASDFVLI